ncbi:MULTISPECIES: hypothetical protein [unclassified Streptomyces]|uniref:hypothetical protein n=1 Tax=unclassified Streptomyces TaxID=2593676 RepID=UPI002024BB8B|nr:MULTISPECIES: hypothetical protein [unclassified Streptomyces]MCX4550598.1 hypothetical protein [Streptomyces sp. NBC_01500]WSC22043.1 hypothetical protein OIE60_21445 [Streptomyces sp. NBC_01766]
MACSCSKKRQQWEVVAAGGKGKVLYSSVSKATSEAVARRYKDSQDAIVREKPKEDAASKAEKTSTR